MSENRASNSVAPWYDIPYQIVVNIEHPGIVKNIDSVISSLGGDRNINSFFDSSSSSKNLGLFLRPEDPFRTPIGSQISKASDIVLRVTVPVRTGRKRKRGSSEPFGYGSERTPPSTSGSASRNLRSLFDNPQSSHVQGIGSVEESLRFRVAPDFQFSVASSPLAQSLGRIVTKYDYENLKEFKLDTHTRGAQQHMDMIPPPMLSQKRVHFNYAYHQNPSVKFVHDENGKEISVNTAIVPKTANQLVSFNVQVVPQATSAGLAPIESLDARMQSLIKQIQIILSDRPIITRRALYNKMVRSRTAKNRRTGMEKGSIHDNDYDIKYALGYVCYMFRSGPWKDALIEFGVDPRTNNKYRVYQTVAFQIERRESSKTWEDTRFPSQRYLRGSEANADSHLFDGKKIVLDGKIWQACDITDPALRKFLDEDTLRNTCDIQQDGWYNNGAWAKLRAIMRDKIATIMSGGTPDDIEYSRICQIPNILEQSMLQSAYITTNVTAKEQTLASQIRTLAKAVEIQQRRYNLMSARNKIGTRDDSDIKDNEASRHATPDGVATLTYDYEEEEEDDDANGDVLGEDESQEVELNLKDIYE